MRHSKLRRNIPEHHTLTVSKLKKNLQLPLCFVDTVTGYVLFGPLYRGSAGLADVKIFAVLGGVSYIQVSSASQEEQMACYVKAWTSVCHPC